MGFPMKLGYQIDLALDRLNQGTLTEREGFGTVDLLIKIGCFVKKISFSMKSSLSELVRTRRSTVLILSLQ